jgi:hypothetical protein
MASTPQLSSAEYALAKARAVIQLRKIAKLKNPARTEQAMAWAAEFGLVQD